MFLKHAIELARQGFRVFPLVANSKTPLIENFTEEATTDEEKIKAWWLDPVLGLEQPYNIGIPTNDLLVVDVDNKGIKKGDEELLKLELSGLEFPSTRTQYTPTGGKHLIYKVKEPIKQGVNKLGKGLDIRGRGGYIVGSGSVVSHGPYLMDNTPLVDAPQWIIDKCGLAPEKQTEKKTHNLEVNQVQAIERTINYLRHEAPQSIKGSGGDATAYQVAARVKDFGVNKVTALELMMEHWYGGSGWSPDKLKIKIDNAYSYGTEEVGSASPEAAFEPIKSESDFYLDKINKEYALIFGGLNHSILHETFDSNGKKHLSFMTEHSFKRKFSIDKVMDGKKLVSYAESWLDWKGRREYAGLCFIPEGPATSNGYYNLWKGFTCSPLPYDQGTEEQRRGLDMFLEHARENVCDKDPELFKWLMGYFAHLIQKPYERPLTTLAFRGRKGTGKNTLVDRIGKLLGTKHYLVTADGRYLTSNFNGHMDSCLCLVLDEAFWSGDKAAEGKLKALTTSPEILIERKGMEAYVVNNYVRLIVIGNEDWLVPASMDERRYAVFQVTDGRIQDQKFFSEMREILDDKGGNQLLLHYLKTFDLSTVDVNKAPNTQALTDQKLATMEPLYQWWLECLSDGVIVGADFMEGWEKQVDKDVIRDAFNKYLKSRNIKSWIKDRVSFTKALKSCLPSLITNQKRRTGDKYTLVYRLPDLETARSEWENYIKQKTEWDV